jgi:hypothetical protein
LFLKFLNIFKDEAMQSKINNYKKYIPSKQSSEFKGYRKKLNDEIRKEFLRFFQEKIDSRYYKKFSDLKEDLKKELTWISWKYTEDKKESLIYKEEKDKIEKAFEYFLSKETVDTTNYKPDESIANPFDYLQQ